jgi:LSD1 subclass zinc finger protein
VNCPACGAPLRLDSGAESLTCDYCHSVYFPEKNDDGVRVLSVAADYTCPVCGIPMMDASLEGTRIHYCTRCRGMLIDMEVFAALVEEIRAGQEGAEIPQTPPDRSELERHLSCPHCHQTMDTHFYAGPGHVILSDCDHCNVNWLDHSKLMRIARGADALRDYGEEPR